jgi:hypothetical protein
MIRTDSSEGSTGESTICLINIEEKDWSTVCCLIIIATVCV